MPEAAAGGAAGTGQPGAGTQASATGGTGAGQGASEWTAGFSEDMRGFVQNKGWKNAQEVADSYRNLEKSFGVPKDRLLHLPESWEGPEAQAVWEKLGKPKDAKGYALKVPEKGGDPKLAEWAGNAFLKNNLTAKQAEGVMGEWNTYQEAVAKQTADNQKVALTQVQDKLKNEWGAAYEKNMNLAKSGMMALELDAATVDIMANAMGAEKVFKQLSKIGAGVGEASFISGRPAGD